MNPPAPRCTPVTWLLWQNPPLLLHSFFSPGLAGAHSSSLTPPVFVLVGLALPALVLALLALLALVYWSNPICTCSRQPDTASARFRNPHWHLRAGLTPPALVFASLTPPVLVLTPPASLAHAMLSPGTESPILCSSQLQNKSLMPGTSSHLVGLGIDSPALVLASLT
jgi:hypothetical protein